MKTTLLIITVLFFGMHAISQNTPIFAVKQYSQRITNPYSKSKGSDNLFISKIETSSQFSVISFNYKNQSDRIEEIFLKPGNFYISVNGRKYGVMDFKNIEGYPNSTQIQPYRTHNFYVYFEPLPSNVSEFDIIEDQGDFDFYGVTMQSSPPDVALSRFTKVYNYGRKYNRNNQTWGEEAKVDNTFVFNINNQGDFVRITDSGIIKRYNNVKAVEASDGNLTYYEMTAKDHQGDLETFHFYDDDSYGMVLFLKEGAIIQLFKK